MKYLLLSLALIFTACNYTIYEPTLEDECAASEAVNGTTGNCLVEPEYDIDSCNTYERVIYTRDSIDTTWSETDTISIGYVRGFLLSGDGSVDWSGKEGFGDSTDEFTHNALESLRKTGNFSFEIETLDSLYYGYSITYKCD